MAKEVTEKTGLNVTYLRRLSDEGHISYIKTLGGHRRYSWNDIKQYLKDNLVPKKSDEKQKKKKKKKKKTQYLKEV
jgi:excisionase family DNA binding protein